MITPSEKNQASSSLQLDRDQLKYQWEPFSSIARELFPLLKEQQEEVGRNYQDFDPDWNRYFEYERAGILHIWTVRNGCGALVGYFVCFVIHGLHAVNTKHCYADLFWLAPEWRDGFNGLRFLRSAAEASRDLGAQVLRWETNDTFEPDASGRSRVARLLERIGFTQVGSVMQMRLT